MAHVVGEAVSDRVDLGVAEEGGGAAQGELEEEAQQHDEHGQGRDGQHDTHRQSTNPATELALVGAEEPHASCEGLTQPCGRGHPKATTTTE